MNLITSDSALLSIEHPFKVSAGPGAGKTHWLTQHMNYVLRRSSRLGMARKIACITYTNTGVETILKRMDSAADRLEVSTIHSFLYKHVVKPYVSLIASEFGLRAEDVDGHDDTILSSYSLLEELKEKTGQKRIQDNAAIVSAIEKARWRFDGENLVCRTDFPIKIDGYSIKNDSYFEYKKLAWGKAKLHHDDILFFSYQILDRYPFVLTILRAKFPYFFVDEFQDTNPIQAEILVRIADGDSIVGVIGDPAQSIYTFQGADISRFLDFKVSGMVSYTMLENRRSTQAIVSILNSIRSDIRQSCISSDQGNIPTLMVGAVSDAIDQVREDCSGANIQTLTRRNITSNALRRGVFIGGDNKNIITDLYRCDNPSSSNKYRSKVITACCKAVELARENKFKDAMLAMEVIFPYEKDKGRRASRSIKAIQNLISDIEDFEEKTLMDFYLYVKREIDSSISGFRAGSAKGFYESHTYKQLALCMNMVDGSDFHKTIHKAKGDEFDNVLLVLSDENDLEFLLSPNLISTARASEEQRIYYVALSRAKYRLFISVPSLDGVKESKLRNTVNILRI